MRKTTRYAAALVAVALAAALAAGALVGCASEADVGSASSDDASVVQAGDEAAGDQEAAEALIGQSLSREEIEEAVGSGERFEMNSAGCERGVYAGYFYYADFTIFSRTYDKGTTFTVVSVDQ